MNAYITIGASSSGKSTFAEAMVKTSQGKTVKYQPGRCSP